jgi:hypothetical protein
VNVEVKKNRKAAEEQYWRQEERLEVFRDKVPNPPPSSCHGVVIRREGPFQPISEGQVQNEHGLLV